MTQQHPITPPPELVQQWHNEAMKCFRDNGIYQHDIATQAARWGADQELEACINYFLEYDSSWGENSELVTGLRAARRPKPPSLAERALQAWHAVETGTDDQTAMAVIRRALELLQELEGSR
jgi:hypothetical protein